MGELRVIGKSSTVMVGDNVKGDLRIIWKNNNVEEVFFAEKIFNEYIHQGWIAIGEIAGKKKQIFIFDPNLEKIILAPLMVGG
jgi:hypothetical protein